MAMNFKKKWGEAKETRKEKWEEMRG